MLSVYWFSFLIGGIFVLLAVVGGIDGVEFEFEADTDVDLRDQGDGRSPKRSSRSAQRGFTLLDILTSFKFWTFGSCFFGLTGLVMTFLRVPPPLVIGIAIAMGLLAGFGMSSVLLSLRRGQADSLIRAEDLVGCTGTVEIPFDATSRGKVRLNLKGTSRDFVAMTDHPSLLTVGTPVMVVGTKNNRVWVVAEETLKQSPAA